MRLGNPLLALLSLLLLSACLRAPVTPYQRESGFTLHALEGQRIAVWPLAGSTLDAEAAATVGKVFQGQEAFLASMEERLSAKLQPITAPGSLSSRQVAAALTLRPECQAFLKPLGWLPPLRVQHQVSDGPVPVPGLEKLAAQPFLAEIRYLVVPMNAAFGKATFDHYDPQMKVLDPYGPVSPVYTPVALRSSAASEAQLSLAVVDLQKRVVVWGGYVATIVAHDAFTSGETLREAEDRIADNLAAAVKGALSVAR